MAKVHVKKNDSVFVLSGKDAGKTGKILDVFPGVSRVVVEGVNIISRHTKPKGRYQQGGIIKREAPLHSSNVMLVCPKCDRPTRVGEHSSDTRSPRTHGDCAQHGVPHMSGGA